MKSPFFTLLYHKKSTYERFRDKLEIILDEI